MEKRIHVSLLGIVRFGILLGILLFLWWFFRSYLLLLAIVLMLGGLAASAWVLWSSRERIAAQIGMPQGRVGRKGSFPIYIRVQNPCRFWGFSADMSYSWGNVFTGFVREKKEHIWIPPGKGYESGQLLESSYAGRIEVKFLSFVLYDPLHLFYLTECSRRDNGVIAYPMPTLVPDEEIYSCVDGFPREEEIQKRGTEYNPDYEIREYIPGDELKRIHWKLTAKQGRLMVRERLKAGRQKMNVLLPLSDDIEENDGLMESLYYLVWLLLTKEYPVQLYWLGMEQATKGCFIAELGELETVIGEILSGSGIRVPGSAQEQMKLEYPGESYILVQTGVYKGAYIR